MANAILIRHKLDPTGKSPDNLVSAEPHTLVSRDVRAILPKYGAFFYGSEIVTDAVSGTILTRGTHYSPGEMLENETAKYGKQICRMILLTAADVSNNITITYQALGDVYGVSTEAIISLIETLELDSRSISYNDILDKPPEFPAASHLHDLGDVYGFEYVVTAIDRVLSAIQITDAASHDAIYQYFDNVKVLLEAMMANTAAALATHMADKNNPHNTTAEQLSVYTKAQTLAITNPILSAINTHITRTDNPHNVTAAQINAYIKSEVDALLAAINQTLANHTNNTSNPHNVTAAQLGVYIKSEVDNLINSLSSALNNALSSHINNGSNPHNTTAAQVGAYTIAQVDSLIQGINNAISAHASNFNNPHGTTAAQLGVYTTSQIDSLISSLRGSLTTNINAHINNTSNPHGVTAGMVGAYTKEQIDSLILTEFNTLNALLLEHVSRRDNPHNVTAAQLGVYTAAEIDAKIATYRAAVVAHERRMDNPHSITADQLNAYTSDEVDVIIQDLYDRIRNEFFFPGISTGMATLTRKAESGEFAGKVIYELRYNAGGNLQLYKTTLT